MASWKRRAVSLILFFIIPATFSAQVLSPIGDRYMVFFTDKLNSNFSVDSPEEFLSNRALDRRNKHNTQIDVSDLPVNESYVSELEELGVSAYFRTKWMNGVLVQMPSSLLNQVSVLSFVSSIELVAPGSLLLDEEIIRGPAGATLQVPISSTERTITQNTIVGVPAMHQRGLMGDGVMIAVFDSGFPNVSRIDAFSHLTSNNQVLFQRDIVQNQDYIERGHPHGLQVLSILAAQHQSFKGVAPESTYLLFRTEDAETEFRVEEYNWLFAAEAADSAGVDIISASVGYSTFDDDAMDYEYADMDGETTIISRAAGLAFEKGILVVTSAGNKGNQAWQFITAPADHPNVLAIGAVNSTLGKAGLSSIGPNSVMATKPDLAALGSGTVTINEDGEVELSSGTSFATPTVAGLAIGLLQAIPELTNVQLSKALKSSGNQSTSPDNLLGYGIPNFESALRVAMNRGVTPGGDVLVYPNPSGDEPLTLLFGEDDFGTNQRIELISSQGRITKTWSFTPGTIKDSFEISSQEIPAGLYLLRFTRGNEKITKKLIKY